MEEKYRTKERKTKEEKREKSQQETVKSSNCNRCNNVIWLCGWCASANVIIIIIIIIAIVKPVGRVFDSFNRSYRMANNISLSEPSSPIIFFSLHRCFFLLTLFSKSHIVLVFVRVCMFTQRNWWQIKIELKREWLAWSTNHAYGNANLSVRTYQMQTHKTAINRGKCYTNAGNEKKNRHTLK